MGDRIADDFGHQTARGYTLFNLTTRYRYKSLEAFFTIENLTNTDWREAQFLFTSRVRGEPAAGVDDIHFTPGNALVLRRHCVPFLSHRRLGPREGRQGEINPTHKP